MKKFLVLLPFSLLDKVLLMKDDFIYAEPVREMTHIYSPKTKKYIGKVSSQTFEKMVMEIPM